jgi:hypothetical protein
LGLDKVPVDGDLRCCQELEWEGMRYQGVRVDTETKERELRKDEADVKLKNEEVLHELW